MFKWDQDKSLWP